MHPKNVIICGIFYNAGVYTVYNLGVYTVYTDVYVTWIAHNAVCLAKLIKLGWPSCLNTLNGSQVENGELQNSSPRL